MITFITYHRDVEQGSDAWHALRCGLLTASTIDLIITPTLKVASNDKERTHLYELLAQRATQYVEPTFIGSHMIRGREDEIRARAIYADRYGVEVEQVGFVTCDFPWGRIGASPDGLVETQGMIEVKSRLMKHQVETILADAMPADYLLQVQTALLVTQRGWCDFVSICGGMPLFVKRVYPDPKVQGAIIDAACAFEGRMVEAQEKFLGIVSKPGTVIVDRLPDETEIHE